MMMMMMTDKKAQGFKKGSSTLNVPTTLFVSGSLEVPIIKVNN